MILPPYFWPIVAVLGGILLALLLVVVALEWSARSLRAALKPVIDGALEEVAAELYPGLPVPDGRHNQTQMLTGI